MTYLRALSGLAILSVASACGEPVPDIAAEPQQIGVAELLLADGTSAGTATIQGDGPSVTLTMTAQNLPAGPHGFHLHQVGKCEAPDFTSAGGHLNPLNKAHGALSDDGSHVGDLPNLEISADGSGTLTTPVQGNVAEVTDWVHDQDGTAIMIHIDADDYITDPTGNAGGRLACGVLLTSDQAN